MMDLDAATEIVHIKLPRKVKTFLDIIQQEEAYYPVVKSSARMQKTVQQFNIYQNTVFFGILENAEFMKSSILPALKQLLV